MKWMKRAGCLLLCALVLGGCSLPGTGKLADPYDFAARTSLYGDYQAGTDGAGGLASESLSGKADSFAKNLCVVTGQGQSQDPSVTAEAAAVFDITGHKVLYSKNVFERLYPASITKVMTALLAMEKGNLSDMVTVTQDAVITEPGATLCGIKPGDKLTMEQLLYGMLLPSGNDAAAAIAVHMAGSVEKFSQMMNQEALSLGATGTHFVNPHGLQDENHYTTAYDLYLIFNQALKQPLFRQIIKTSSYTADYQDGSGNPVSKTWLCSNLYITGQQPTPYGLTVLGGKTGTTKAAGNCLIMGSDDAKGREYVSVVLKAKGRPSLYQNMTNIIEKIVD